jgi:hypothetical protein
MLVTLRAACANGCRGVRRGVRCRQVRRHSVVRKVDVHLQQAYDDERVTRQRSLSGCHRALVQLNGARHAANAGRIARCLHELPQRRHRLSCSVLRRAVSACSSAMHFVVGLRMKAARTQRSFARIGGGCRAVQRAYTASRRAAAGRSRACGGGGRADAGASTRRRVRSATDG